ncbi:MAG: hypothetical protein K2L41_02560 [Muribaculaceae bacterium]|nr:hypothetical protein [Muribaculaceae bacterium]
MNRSITSYISRFALLLIASLAGTAVTEAQEQFKRGLEQYSFIPKGQWITGVNVSWSQASHDNYQFFILEDIKGDAYSFKVSPMLIYCFNDNLAAGGRFA